MSVAVQFLDMSSRLAKGFAALRSGAEKVVDEVMKGPAPAKPVPTEAPSEPKQKTARVKSRGVRASKSKYPQYQGAEYVGQVFGVVKDLLNGEQSGDLRLKQIRSRLPNSDWRVAHAAVCALICAGRIRWRGTRFTVMPPVAA